ncbi:MAG: LysR family transcriptional regulator [Limimaricola sp.]|uniref:LysR family transcriptional regulator n=1 Tax=Limimaricola sp. TaxID=2211665 RepID=UPI001E0AB473|nr:LysR family transcriptional regulator [Limimaricola sp.]MBI1417496.1 LysR family transcriptional regulator [Limimaricola sp.]
MERLNWDDIRLFLALARDGTLSGAARSLGVGVATISRRIDRIEHAIGLPLFLRSQQGYALTDQGAALLPRAERMELAAHEMRLEAALQVDIRGKVRVASIESLITPIVIPALAPLLQANPGLEVEVMYSPVAVNLHRHDADLALRMVVPDGGNLLVRRLATMGFGLYGPADGTRPDRHVTWPDLAGVDTLLAWSKAFGAENGSRFSVNSLEALLEAVQRGIGIGVLPHFLARQAGLRLIADELPQGGKMERPVLLATHAELAASRRVRAVADAIAEQVIGFRRQLETGATA